MTGIIAVVSDDRGFILEAPDEETGRELVKRWNAFPDMYRALNDLIDFLEPMKLYLENSLVDKGVREAKTILNRIDNK